MDSAMPTNYDQQYTTSSSGTNVIDVDWIKSVPSIFKMIEMVFSLITFICASVHADFIPKGGGWVQFVSMVAFIVTAIVFIFYMFRIVDKISGLIPWKFTEFVFYAVSSLFYFIAGIVAAAFGYMNAAVGAAAFFCFACLIIYGVDGYLKFTVWRSSGDAPTIWAPEGAGGAGAGGASPPPPTVETVGKGPQY